MILLRSIADLYLTQVSDGKILENNIPVFVITFATQEMLLFRNAKTKEIMVGSEDKVEQCHYAAVITRVEDDLANELTGGWKVMEVRLLYRTCSDSSLVLTVIVLSIDGSQIGPCVLIDHRSCHSQNLVVFGVYPTTTHNFKPIHYYTCFAFTPAMYSNALQQANHLNYITVLWVVCRKLKCPLPSPH